MIVITAPTGQIGSKLLQHLLGGNEAVRVIARDPAKLPGNVREQIEVIQGSHGDAAVVNQAFHGADAVFWLVPPDPKASSIEAAYVDFSGPACDAFTREEVKHVIGVSSLAAANHRQAMPGTSLHYWHWTI